MQYFQPRQKTTPSNLPFTTRPSVEREFSAFVSEQDGFAALIHQDVKDAISREAFKALPNETIGLLAGRVLRDERGPYTLVLAAQGARPDEIDATPSHVHISANGHAQVRSRLEGSAYGLDIIGWYHSHPRFPARFSPVDVTEQSTWRDPNHIGIVISGLDYADQFGVYRGPQATLLTGRMPIPPPPPPPPPFPAEKTSEIAVQPGHTETQTDAAVAQVVKTLSTKRKTRLYTAARFIPWALALGLLGMLLNLVWLNRRINRIEANLVNSRSAVGSVPPLAPTITPTPLLPARAAEGTLFDPKVSSSKPDLQYRPVTKALGLSPTPTRPRDTRARTNRKRSAPNGSAPKSDSGAKQTPTTKRSVSSQTNSNQPVVIPGQKLKAPPRDSADRPTKP